MKETASKFPAQQRYSNKMHQAGLRRVTVWVREEKVDEIRQIAAKMRVEK